MKKVGTSDGASSSVCRKHSAGTNFCRANGSNCGEQLLEGQAVAAAAYLGVPALPHLLRNQPHHQPHPQPQRRQIVLRLGWELDSYLPNRHLHQVQSSDQKDLKDK